MARIVQLVWVNRQGEGLGEIGEPQEQILQPSLSSDEDLVAALGEDSISIHYTNRSISRAVTDSSNAFTPLWYPSDPSLIVYSTDHPRRVVVKSWNYTDEPRSLFDGGSADSFSSDGNFLAYPFREIQAEHADIATHDLRSSAIQVGPLPNSANNEAFAQISPIGQYIACPLRIDIQAALAFAKEADAV